MKMVAARQITANAIGPNESLVNPGEIYLDLIYCTHPQFLHGYNLGANVQSLILK
jgi:hypothetical protein